MTRTRLPSILLTCVCPILVVAGCAAAPLSTTETPGQHFELAMRNLAANCAKAKLKKNDTACDILKLKPADPLATEEGRFAHSIQIPHPLPDDSGYKQGMTSEQYFNHLCNTEAGEFIYKTVENVEGLYMMRPRKEATDDELEHLYALEDPYGHEDWEATSPEKLYVRPERYRFLEVPLFSPNTPSTKETKYLRYTDYDGQDSKTMGIQEMTNRTSRYGYIWRGISRSHDRELGIAGGELIVLDWKTNEILAVKRGFIRSGGVRNLTGIWWPNGQICPRDAGRSKLFFAVEFIVNVLKPQSFTSKEIDNASK